jgi:N-acetylglutamate synthase-like GNAT family acetyltransferase
MKIRRYKDSDYAKIRKNLTEAKMFDKVRDRKENIKKMVKLNHQAVLVAEEKNEVVGSVFLIMASWEAMIYRLAVKKSMRGKGIGSMILKEAEKRMKRLGIKEVYLLTDTKDKKLHRFYTDRGYNKGLSRASFWKKL